MKQGRTILIISFFFFCSGTGILAQNQSSSQLLQKKIPANFCISPEEMDLYDKINAYRESLSLPPISISRSLSYVAKTHARDLFFNNPDQGDCNSHSWSGAGNWKPFCYPGDEKKNNSVWDKPKELTPYNSKGYEIVYWENNPVNIDSVLPFWKSIDYFNSFLVSNGKWQGKTWMAVGIGICENYASVWFGEAADPEGQPWICGREPVKQPTTEPPATEPVQAVNEQDDIVQKTEIRADTAARSVIYYIIVSSQQPREKSRKFSEELITKGYKDAKVLINGNKVRVSIMEFREKPSADSALKEVKKSFRDAWIYKLSNQ